MKVLIFCILILGFVSSCLCERWNINAAPTKNNIYNVVDYGARGDGVTDDTQAFLKAWKNACGAKGASTLLIPPKKLYLVNNLLFNGECKAKSILIQSSWIRIQYVNSLTIDGTSTGRIDGFGSTWWPCKSCRRPIALSFHSCNDLTVSNVRITNSPGGHISINGCNNAKFSHMDVQSPGDSPNTDGFDISSSKNILIEDSNIRVGDDCIAINGGSSYINASRLACGPGHGISIGSLGRGNSYETVEEVHVQNCKFTNTTNGARIKTFPGGSGYARKISFEQIHLTNVKNPIIIDQHYGESAVKVSDVRYYGIKGTSASDVAINLKCESCFNVVLDQINIVSSQPKKKAQSYCKNFHGKIGSTIPKVNCN
ncbi:polygalacturonase ADPG1 [Lathyrus oleraceus]|uniref:polygalacturonase ADPG1 n=1 Tax=Pisum sativum TaxID=3888 RepID=UPI0021D14E7C|nr:polygalacturonase ADPG1-like [Pisum sativum]